MPGSRIFPNATPSPTCPFPNSSTISAMNIMNSVRLSGHPCLSPTPVQNSSDSSSFTFTTFLVSSYTSFTFSVNPLLILHLSMSLHNLSRLNMSKAAFKSTKNACTFPLCFCVFLSITYCSINAFSNVLLCCFCFRQYPLCFFISS